MDYWNTFLAWYILSPNEIRNNYEFKQSMNKINDAYKTSVMDTPSVQYRNSSHANR